MATIFHLALASDWAEAEASGVYTTSTRGRTLAEEGFIHASRADQWTGVRERFYADVAEPLVLLQIDTDLLDVPVIEEPPAPGITETFPHIYGPLRTSAVVRAMPLAPTPTAGTPAPSSGTTAAPATMGESFTRVYFRELFINAALLLLVIGVSVVGMAAGLAINEDKGPGVGGLLGLGLGLYLARAIHLARQDSRSGTSAPPR